jgi:hypothetical protein
MFRGVLGRFWPSATTAVAVTALAVAIVTPTSASATGKTKCSVAVTALNGGVKPLSGTPPTSGSELIAGAVDGKICRRAFHGAIRVVTTFISPGKSTEVGRIFGPLGSIRIKGHTDLAPQPDGSASLSGGMKMTGGTGLYRGVTGSLSVSGTIPAHSTVAILHITGTIKL